jgi:hypothetical protein
MSEIGDNNKVMSKIDKILILVGIVYFIIGFLFMTINSSLAITFIMFGMLFTVILPD